MGALLCDSKGRETDSASVLETPPVAHGAHTGEYAGGRDLAAVTTLVLPRTLDENLTGYAFKVGLKKRDLIKLVLSEYLTRHFLESEEA